MRIISNDMTVYDNALKIIIINDRITDKNAMEENGNDGVHEATDDLMMLLTAENF